MEKIRNLLKSGTNLLKNFSTTPALDASILLSYALNFSKEDLLLKSELLVKPDLFYSFIERRKLYEPIAYIIGEKEFYGINFEINNSVLIPRPETEFLTESLIEIVTQHYPNGCNVSEACTGSGCVIISALLNLPKNVKAKGFEISEKALELSKKNAQKLLKNYNLKFILQDITKEDFEFEGDILVSNPPYISNEDYKNLELNVLNYEPKIALIGGDDGLFFYNIIAKKAKNIRFILLEIGQNQEEEIKKIFENKGFFLKNYKKDLNQIIRCLIFEKL